LGRRLQRVDVGPLALRDGGITRLGESAELDLIQPADGLGLPTQEGDRFGLDGIEASIRQESVIFYEDDVLLLISGLMKAKALAADEAVSPLRRLAQQAESDDLIARAPDDDEIRRPRLLEPSADPRPGQVESDVGPFFQPPPERFDLGRAEPFQREGDRAGGAHASALALVKASSAPNDSIISASTS